MPTMEKLTKRRGDNLYPVAMNVTFGDNELHLDVPAGVWNPTPHGVHLGNVLAELDLDGETVLELGTGCGLHAIAIARSGAESMVLTEIDDATLDNARHNLAKHDIDIPVEYLVANWTSVETDELFDVVVTNPPFAKSGKRYRRYFIDTLIRDAHRLLKPGGKLVFVQSSMADLPRTLGMLDEEGATTEILGQVDGPFRDYYFEDAAFMREVASVPNGYHVRDGVYYETLTVLRATFPDAQPG